MLNFFVSTLFCFFMSIGATAPVPQVSFDSSMQLANYSHIVARGNYPNIYQTFKKNYERFCSAQGTLKKFGPIPKKIHQIWLGSPFPEKYKDFQKSWIEHHPGWEYILWTDNDLKKFDPEIQEMVKKAAQRNYGEASDILRYEILRKFGGLYVDTDMQCLHSHAVLHEICDFYIGIQPLDTNIVQLGIGLIGTVAGHPFFYKALKAIKNSKETQTIVRTGPILFTKIFTRYVDSIDGANFAFPATYFYPCGYTQNTQEPASWKKPESFAIHHWEGSWLKKIK